MGTVPMKGDGSMQLIDLSRFYEGTAKLAETDSYLSRLKERSLDGKDVVITGRAPVWLYLKVAHALHGRAARLFYESPVTGKIMIFDHDPY